MRLFYSKRKVYTIHGKFIALFFICFIFCMLILFVYNTCYSGTIKEKARIKANEVAISAINKAVDSTLTDNDFDYESFFSVNVKNDMSVSYITLNTIAANKFKTEITQKILDTASSYTKEEILMSPFSAYGYANVPFGIKMPIIVIPVEILSTDFISELDSHGINQTLHMLSIKIKIKIKLLLPIGSETFDVETTVPVVETVIVGNVPDTYTNVEGVTETGSDAILNLAP